MEKLYDRKLETTEKIDSDIDEVLHTSEDDKLLKELKVHYITNEVVLSPEECKLAKEIITKKIRQRQMINKIKNARKEKE